MNNAIEESLKIKEAIRSYQAKIPKLEDEQREAMGIQSDLDDEALRSKILEERGWEKKKAKADENRAKITRIKEEIKECGIAIDVFKERFQKIRPQAVKEFEKKYRKKSEGDLMEFGKKLKEAAEAEARLVEKREGIAREVRRTLSNGMGPYPISSSILAVFSPILTGGFMRENKSLYRHFLKTCEEQGINVD